MSETEKQEGQKTVVAFIAGLLIGGLLVWVFSSSPEEAPADVDSGDDTPAMEEGDDTNTGSRIPSGNTPSASDANRETNTNTNTNTRTIPSGEGSLSVNNQAAGPVVALDAVSFPNPEGWVVVRDYENGVSGKILGAARFHQQDGLLPSSVNLLRATEAGKTYQVVFYTENGDKVFDLEDDVAIANITETFTAQ